jgi:hypothetical protein
VASATGGSGEGLATGFGSESLQLPSARATNAQAAAAGRIFASRLQDMGPPVDTAPDQSLMARLKSMARAETLAWGPKHVKVSASILLDR